MKKAAYVALVTVLVCGVAGAQQYNVLYTFQGVQAGDGSNPLGNLVFDSAGNIYGTTWSGGSSNGCFGGCGAVFKLSSGSDGSWTETTIYQFCTSPVNGACLDGSRPAAGLVVDAAGNLYGTTTAGGPLRSVGDCGTVFELSPPSSPGGSWTEAVLYDFCSVYVNGHYLDGLLPYSQLSLDGSGNLYGTTSAGGSGSPKNNNGAGVAFELIHGPNGWTESILYNFCSVGNGICLDGQLPMAGMTFDQNGNLYGTTQEGGDFQGRGTLYLLTPGSRGWTETVMALSKQSGALFPLGAVSIDRLGNRYSTFSSGGQYGFGGVFKIGRQGERSAFSFNGSNGYSPTAGVLLNSTQGIALYGTTSEGGTNQSGVVFKITAPSNESILYNFCSQPNCADGAIPTGALVADKLGNLYGTTKLGGVSDNGVVFEIMQSGELAHLSRSAPARQKLLALKK